MSSFNEIGLWALGIYLAALIGVTAIARAARRDLTPSDHFLAGRELGVFVLFLTLYATAYSGNSLLGYPGRAYNSGFSYIMATGFMMSIIVAFHLLVPKLRPIASAEGFVTPGDWVRHRFGAGNGGRALAIGVAVIMTITLANFLFAQLKAMGEMAEQVTGGAIPYAWGVVGLALVILVYETLGGMRAVAWTDSAQGILMLFGLAALLAWLLAGLGGLGALTLAIAEARPEAVFVPDADGCRNWLSTILLLGLASVVYPQAIQRVYAARSGATLKRSLALMTFMPLTTTLVVTLIGLAAIPLLPGLDRIAADRVMPLLLEQWAAAGPLAAVAAVVVFLGALAAIMSTADSVLLSLGSIVAEDLLGGSRREASTTARGKLIAGLVMVSMAALAIGKRDITLWHLIELKMDLLIQCVPAFMVAIHWSRLRAAPAAAGLVAGSVVVVAGVFGGVEVFRGVHIGVIGLAVNASVSLLGSLLPERAPRAAEAMG